MRTLPWLLAVMLIAAPALTGCIGFGGEDGGGEDEPGNETNERDDTGNASDGDETSDDGFGDDEEDGTGWQEENRTGTVSPTSQLTGEGVSETFSVPEGTEALAINLSADGGELDMCIIKPGGDGSGNRTDARSAQQEECDEVQTTEDGNASFQATGPEPGGWTVELTAIQGTTSEVEYTLTIAQKVPLEEQATDDEDDGSRNSTAERATIAPCTRDQGPAALGTLGPPVAQAAGAQAPVPLVDQVAA